MRSSVPCTVAAETGFTQYVMQSPLGANMKKAFKGMSAASETAQGFQFSFFGLPKHFQRFISFLEVSTLLMHIACNCIAWAPWLKNYTQS